MSVKKIVEITETKRHLALFRGLMEIRVDSEPIGRVPLDDILSLIISGYGCTHSSNLLAALAERNVPVAICSGNYSPVAWVLPVVGHSLQSARMIAQCKADKPKRKGLWRDIVRRKILNQAAALVACGISDTQLQHMSRKVSSGDRENMEAQAAKLYWRLLMGDVFRRDKQGTGINGMLNYGYAILRSCVARATLAAGLHPTLGIHHQGPTNPMCLVDDLMEPFRPVADLMVKQLWLRGARELEPEVKSKIASLAVLDFPTDEGLSPLFLTASKLSLSLANVYLGKQRKLDLPDMPSPLELATLAS